MSKKSFNLGHVDSIVFCGGGALAVECAKKSIQKRLQVHFFAAKRHLEEIIDGQNNYTMEEVLAKEAISYYSVNDINDNDIFRKIVSDKTICVGFGEVYTFTQKTIDLFDGKLFDFMTIPLPEYRGGAHFSWQILRNNREGAWNIQIINKEMVPGVFDSGEILMSRKYIIPNNFKLPENYFNVAHEEGLTLFSEFLNKIDKKEAFVLSELDENQSTFFPRLYTPVHGAINWLWDADEIERFICAFDEPYIGASTFYNGKKVYLKKCEIVRDKYRSHPFMAGLIYRIWEDKVIVAARDYSLIFHKVKDDKGNDIISEIRRGNRFYTPYKYLENAMQFNAEYNSEGLFSGVEVKNYEDD